MSMNINNTPILLEIALVDRYACQNIIKASKPFYLKVYGDHEDCNGESYYNLIFQKHGRKCLWYQVYHGRLRAIKWLYDNNINKCNNNNINDRECNSTSGIFLHLRALMDIAADRGHLDVIKYLHEKGADCTRCAMNLAAEHGDLDIVIWLHNNRAEGCTKWAMDEAAGNGNLTMVKWLHHNRTEGCNRYAMNWAAQNGHMTVVQWLHENRVEGCTRDAQPYAMWRGHTAIVDYLDAHNLDGNTDVKCNIVGCLGFGH